MKILDQTWGDYDSVGIRVVTRYDTALLQAKAVTLLTEAWFMAALTHTELGAFLGRAVTEEQGQAVLEVVTALAKAYVRSVGFDQWGEPNDEIWAVILSAASRLVVNSPNPQAVTYEVHGPDAYRHEGSPIAFTTAELAVLNRFRVRAL